MYIVWVIRIIIYFLFFYLHTFFFRNEIWWKWVNDKYTTPRVHTHTLNTRVDGVVTESIRVDKIETTHLDEFIILGRNNNNKRGDTE